MEIQPITTSDNVQLHVLYLPAEGESRATWLITHGVGGAFYRSPLLAVGQELSRLGCSVALLNNRGHDWAWVNRADGRWLGAAYECIEDAALDIQAGLDWLTSRGHSRVILAGHSLGAVKVGYTLTHRTLPEVAATALLSAPRLPSSPSGDPAETQAALAKARELVAGGRSDELIFLTGRAFSARTYLNKYAADANTAILNRIAELRLPALLLAGTKAEGYSDVPMLHHARDLYAALGSPQASLREIEGADHLYAGHEAEVAQALSEWLEHLHL